MDSRIYIRYLNGPLLWMGIVVGLAVVAAVVPTMIDSTWAAILFGALVIIATVACLLMRVKIAVNDGEVAVSVFGVFTKRIPLREITGVSIGPETGLKEGAGPRIVDGAPAYIVSGPTVRFEYGSNALVASAKNPKQVVEDVEARLR
ncbi:hypothetical protein FKE98_03425 [Corynebacterium aurimucosum]|uniref:hypothetical protein n=1 Tax=Corynebacterium TaxID=1716 RepID=UPI0008A2E7A2|nr:MULTISPECIES: hypothetical protein [Corynebacterium]MTE09514.1 hypothetical protein [Corynebacterium guaraldiae]OFM33274.1 hypothetical protein HMPREF2698_06985 [Corynebacterium sp. HMSC072A02]OFN14705.1 hypothetical protein HMPREF2604_02495 [Corynebacterium sp. HMSC055A01]TRX34459.1 hypothetical protein FNY86_01390 [Corynebacterium guaraldiae]TRX39356.1 hypothetical protein FNY89_09355 [Corynebacterium guaraldiae]